VSDKILISRQLLEAGVAIPTNHKEFQAEVLAVEQIRALLAQPSDDTPTNERGALVSEDDLRELASSLCQEALMHGVNEDVFPD
jgi:hypothetical protein